MKNRAWKEAEAIVIGSEDEKVGLCSDRINFVEEYFRFCILIFKKDNLYKRLNVRESNFSRLLNRFDHKTLQEYWGCILWSNHTVLHDIFQGSIHVYR
ncbi:hypothetical protein EDC94DRAFT_598697 [Helicostylum pulchrum]|nr:hypothetical protein EDC94DRAFT_598697 [Helicostylum pulchrum]